MAKDPADKSTKDFDKSASGTDHTADQLPLWRVNYNYTVNGALRSGSYVLPANNPAEAKDQAGKILSEKFTNTGSYYKITNCKPF